jgi:predicted  nucleic acid-binding Zn ribbon protein
MNCSTGERFALNQLEKIDSSLNKRGLEICKKISNLSKKPVYYFLYKNSGIDKRNELERKCPLCGGNWLLKSELHNLFMFKCDKCFIISNIAYSLKR